MLLNWVMGYPEGLPLAFCKRYCRVSLTFGGLNFAVMSQDSRRYDQLHEASQGSFGRLQTCQRGEMGRHTEREGSVWQAKHGIQGYTAILSQCKQISSTWEIAREDEFQGVEETQR